MRLSPVDHVFTGRGGYPINFLFSYNGKLEASAIQDSLLECLNYFSPLKSQLRHLNSHTLEFFETQNSLAWHQQTLHSEVDFDNLESLDSLLSRAKSLPDSPLIEISLTYTPNKSYLGVSISHCVVDGFSYFLFLTTWSQIHRKMSINKPELNREILLAKNWNNTSSEINVEDIFQKTGFALSKIPRPANDDRVEWEIIDFKKNEIDKLYNEATSQTDVRLSVNDVLSAHLWKKIAEAQSKLRSADSLYSLSCAYDYRRVFPNISPLYFGNAIRAASIRLSAEKIKSASLSELAISLNRAVRAIDAKACEESLECLEHLRIAKGLEVLENFHVADPETGFLVTNLSRLPVLDLDFGVGAPNDFRILTPARNTAVVLPLRDGLRVQIAR
ncbi:MAG: hypothetical protein KA116_03915 [Proteobacteria bacterium]|nr:hypothetical protein [Pseudomonadota bacterium]